LAAAAALVGRPAFRIGGGARPASGALAQTGYYISRTSRADHVVVDGGPHGYQNAGHAHADALSMTFAVRGTPLLIDPGTACYTIDPTLRDRFRSTTLHNTVTIDGRSQSIPSGPFHWLHTANARTVVWHASNAFDYFDGTHDGYHPITHRRRVLVLHNDVLIVVDTVEGTGTHAAAAHWHIDPAWNVDVRRRDATFTRKGQRATLVAADGPLETFCGDRASGLGWDAPVYGRVQPAVTLRLQASGALPLRFASVFDVGSGNPVIDVAWTPRSTAAFIEIRISRAECIDTVAIADDAMMYSRDHEGRGRVHLASVGRPIATRIEDLSTCAASQAS
jgi:hypothetical protein